MIVLDVNILVAASRREHPHHDAARSFVQNALGASHVVVPDLVWAGFLRVVTSRRVFRTPTPLPDALAFVRAVVSAERYRRVAGLIDGIAPFLELLADSSALGDLVPDAYIASVALSNGCAVATFDRDFRRFDGLELITPEAP